jgi:leucyl aminopeptidase
MDIQVVTGEITQLETDAIVLAAYSGIKTPDGELAAVDKALDGSITALITRGVIKGALNEITLVHSLGKIPAARVVVVGLGKKKELDTNKVRHAFAEVSRYLKKNKASSFATIILGGGVNGISREKTIQAMSEGTILGLYTFKRYLTKPDKDKSTVEKISIIGDAKDQARLEKAVGKGSIIAEACNWARDIVNEPANHMTPTDLAAEAGKMAEAYGLSIEVLDKEQITKLGMGGLLGVSQGSQQPPKFIIVEYKGKRTDDIDLVLAGKGITFDSGGISIKPSEGMADMKNDMAGGAAMLGTMRAIAQLKPRVNVTALVPATENLPSGTALKPGDIIKAMNGETIEVLNTDAEGRLILADALSYAVKIKAKAIIDAATLTGACMVALGKICTGVFSNNQELADRVLAASKEAGEYAWQLPMFEEYREQLKSDIADIKNIGNRYGGAITAAKFLSDFVKNTPWVHLDIAGTADTSKEKGYQVKGATGVPIRTLVNLMLNMAK